METKQASKPRYSLSVLPFALFHLAAINGLFLVDFSWGLATVLCVSYLVGMFAITGGYHRYFSHRTYSTSRAFQFVLALLGTLTAQKGVLWWAAHHRNHHKYSDQPEDIHSPLQSGLWWAHCGWLLSHSYNETEWDRIKDFAKYPELRWLNKYYLVPPLIMGVSYYLIGGVDLLMWGFMFNIVLLWHATFCINSLTHLIGRRRYRTTDDSRNSLVLALITLGEGWHNNHHHYAHSVKQGFFWWEIDISYYCLKVLSWLGLVWNLRDVPEWALEGKPRRHTKDSALIAEETPPREIESLAA